VFAVIAVSDVDVPATEMAVVTPFGRMTIVFDMSFLQKKATSPKKSGFY
jgi:hypothetical protein